MFKAIIFDVGGVLIENPWPGMLAHYAKHLGVEEAYFQKVFNDVVESWQKGTVDEPAFWQHMCSKLQKALPKTESLWLDGFKKAYQEKSNMFALIKRLKQKGYLIGLLSNTEIPVMKFLIEHEYPDFDAFIYSCGVGKIKPNADIYHEMLAKLHVAPAEAIFVDDKPENIEGAQKVGMTGILFEDEKEFEEELKQQLL